MLLFMLCRISATSFILMREKFYTSNFSPNTENLTIIESDTKTKQTDVIKIFYGCSLCMLGKFYFITSVEA